MALSKFDRVSFHWGEPDNNGVSHGGTGQIVSDADESGHVQVAIDPHEDGAPRSLIYCSLTWLTAAPP